ncbi:uncharacterized protein ACRADG_011203 [Cochliomyia hominivorax]
MNVNVGRYNIVDDQAFTEDNIIIYNLFISYLPKNVTTAEISKYFKQFGKVLNVKCIANKIGSNCFINFADPRVAARVLQRRRHVIRNSKIHLKPSFSYYQPDGQRIIAQLRKKLNNDVVNNDTASFSSCNNSITTEQSALILTLNDDCLEYICKQLKPKDQINFALTCQRFCNIFKMISSVQYTNLSTDFFTDMTLWECRIFLEIVGPQVKILILEFWIEHREKIYINFFTSLCRNVEKLVILCPIEINSLRKMFGTMKNLKELELIYLNDNMISNLKQLKNLKCLSITNNNEITGKNIHLLQDLEKLSLIECINIKPGHFRKICENLRNLQLLDIRSCQFEFDVFKYILEYLTELKTIKFTPNNQNFNCLAELPKLKHLEMYNCKNYVVMEEFVKNLVKYKAEKLETFKLFESPSGNFNIAPLLSQFKHLKVLYIEHDTFDDDALQNISQLAELEDISFVSCKQITDKGVLNLLQHCLKLKELDLPYCISITPDFINGAIKLLKEQRDRWLRTNKIKIKLSETPLMKFRLNEIPLKDYSDVLEIILCKTVCGLLELNDTDYVDEFDVDDDDIDYTFEYDSYSDVYDSAEYDYDVFDFDNILFF